MKQKCAVLFSGGLDSRLVVKIMQERGFDVAVLHFKLPFSKDVSKEVGEFCREQKVKLKIFDCCRGKLLRDYLEVLKNAKFGRGAGFNPCVDCKIFMFRHAKRFADKNKIKVIATGEVLGQRPMSQTQGAMKVIDKEVNVELARPLIELGISGRRREKQIELAKKFKIGFPHPAGGCLLCEKELRRKFRVLLKNDLINSKTLKLVNIGRHFFIDGVWFVVARDESECGVIETFRGNFVEGVISNLPTRSEKPTSASRLPHPSEAVNYQTSSLKESRNHSSQEKSRINEIARWHVGYVLKGVKGKPSVYYNGKKGRKVAGELQKAYQTGASGKERKRVDERKL